MLSYSRYMYSCMTLTTLCYPIANASITFGTVRLFKVNRGGSLDISVTGLPVPKIVFKKTNAVVNSGKWQLMGNVFKYGPLEESDYGTYSITASNCFNSVTEIITVDVLSKCWPG